MANKVRTYIDAQDAPTDEALRPKHLTKQEFGQRVYKLMIRKGWNQSELARQAGIARDSVSTYVRGISLPEPLNLERLAKALGVSATELLPNATEAAIDEDVPSLELKISHLNSQRAWLRVNRLVSTAAALKIVEILNADKISDASD